MAFISLLLICASFAITTVTLVNADSHYTGNTKLSVVKNRPNELKITKENCSLLLNVIVEKNQHNKLNDCIKSIPLITNMSLNSFL